MRFSFSVPVRARLVGAMLALLVGGCATAPAQRPARLDRAAALPPSVDAESELLAQLFAAQFALQDDDLAAAARGFAAAAAKSSDPSVAEEATQLALSQKDWALARRGVERWQTLAPKAPGIEQAQAWIALGQGDAKEAFPHLQALAARGDEQGWRLVAQTLLNAPDKVGAAVLLARLVPADGFAAKEGNAVAVSQLAFRLGDKSLARRLADNAVARFHGEDAYAWSAHLAAVSDDAPRAKSIFAEAIARHPRSKRLRAGYATLLGQGGDNVVAANVLAIGTQDQTTYAARAAYAARADDKKLLAALYREVEADQSGRDGARLFLLGQLAELVDQRAAAIDWYRAVPDEDDRYFDAQMRLALVLDQAGRTGEAVDTLHRLVTSADGDPEQQRDAWLLEADILGKRGRKADALKVYAQALTAQPDDERVLYARALFTIDQGDVADGERDLRRIIERQPENAEALNALGYTISDHAKGDAARQREALELIQRALKLKPDEPAIIDSLGWVQYRLGDLDASLKDLRRAYARQSDPDIAAHLGEVLWVKGERAEARRIWEDGRKKDAKNKALLETIERLTR